jgi:hypothetical protein
VNLGKLTKRLKRELTANPKQAAVLAVVCAVGLWFWWPLLSKWLSPKKAEAATAANAPAATKPGEKQEEKKSHTWLEQQAWRQADPRTQPAELPDDARDPFFVPVPEQPAAVADDESDRPPIAETLDPQPEPVAAEPLDPRKLGLVLEAVVYGKTRRLAQINGRTVREQEEVKLSAGRRDEEGEAPPQVSARVVSIGRDEVMLDVAGNSLRLQLQPKLLGEGEIVQRGKLEGEK